MKLHLWNRKLHRWGAIAVALPMLLVIVTGVLLQVKKQWAWVQPPTQQTTSERPTLSFDAILEAASRVPEARIVEWDDVDRLEVRPSNGITKVRARNGWEIQLDHATGEVLQVAYRRSDLIESLHDGSFFHEGAKIWIFLPNGLILLGLWVTGMYLFVIPFIMRAKMRRYRKRSQAAVAARPAAPKPMHVR